MIFGFAFKNKSASILNELPHIDMKWIMFKNNFTYFLQKIKEEKPEYIVGIGLWSGGGSNLRIETVCKNKFRNRPINHLVSSDHQYLIKPIFKTNEHLVYGKGMGTSWCNYFSYQIMEFLTSSKLSCRYAFIHIPKKQKKEIVVKKILTLVVQLK